MSRTVGLTIAREKDKKTSVKGKEGNSGTGGQEQEPPKQPEKGE